MVYRKSVIYSSITAISMGLLTTAPVFAQNTSRLDEIIVTAQKREQSLQDIGAAVSVLGAEDLRVQHVTTGEDLARIVPGLVYATSPNNTPVYTLRGVGFFEQSLAAYPDVSLYVDQFLLPLPTMASRAVFDLERVEVLKGPQGTLFGNNATGGAINFIAAKPTDEFSAGFELSAGRFNTTEASGFISGALTDTLRGRVSVRAENGDGWQKSITRDDKLGEKDNIAGRILLDWDASERLRFSLNVNGSKDKDEPQGTQITRTDPANPPGSVGFAGVVPEDMPLLTTPLGPSSDSRATDWGLEFHPSNDTTFWQTALRTDFDISDNLTLTSLTSYNDLDFEKNQDQDGSAFYLNQHGNHNGSAESFVQELRVANAGHEKLFWVLGANYENTETIESLDVISWDSSLAALHGAGYTRDVNDQEMTNFAAFANIEYNFNTEWALRAGVRRTRAERENTAAALVPAGYQLSHGETRTFTEFFNLVYPLIFGPGVVAEIQEGESFVLDTRVNADGSPLDPSTFMTTGPYNDELNENSTSWSAGVDYRPANDMLVYANISKGYKSGSFPILSAAIFDGLLPVTQEELLAYEVGFKTQIPNKSLQVNATAFYYDYKDKQILTKFVDPIFGLLDRLQNVPKSEVKGVELEMLAEPIAGLTLSTSISYIDSEVTDYTGVIGAGVDSLGLFTPDLKSFSGAELPFAAEWQYSFRANYEFPLSAGLVSYMGVAATGQSDSFSSLAITQEAKDDFEIDSYTIFDMHVGLRSADDKWAVSVWGQNVTDEYYRTNRYLNFESHVATTGRPAEYGISVAVNF